MRAGGSLSAFYSSNRAPPPSREHTSNKKGVPLGPLYLLLARPRGLAGGYAASSSLRSSACRATLSRSMRTSALRAAKFKYCRVPERRRPLLGGAVIGKWRARQNSKLRPLPSEGSHPDLKKVFIRARAIRRIEPSRSVCLRRRSIVFLLIMSLRTSSCTNSRSFGLIAMTFDIARS